MTAIELLRAIGNVDDRHILLSLEDVKKDIKHRACVKWTSLIMCAVIVLTAGVGFYHHHALLPAGGDTFTSPSTQRSTIPTVKEEWTLKYPDENAVCSPYNPDNCVMSVVYYSMDDMAKESDLIVLAEVKGFDYTLKGTGTFQGYFNIFTELTVTETLKGDAVVGETLYVRDYAIGYKDQDGNFQKSKISSVGPKMENGNSVLLFLKVYKDPISVDDNVQITHHISLGAEGKFFLDRDGLYHCTTEYTDDYFSATQLKDYKAVSIESLRDDLAR